MNVRILILLFVIGIISFSCDKHHARKLAGTYTCAVEFSYWSFAPTIIEDSVFYDELVIERKGKEVIVFGHSIHIDELWNEKEYYTAGPNGSLRVLFKNDNVYIRKTSGGQGGEATYDYSGERIE